MRTNGRRRFSGFSIGLIAAVASGMVGCSGDTKKTPEPPKHPDAGANAAPDFAVKAPRLTLP